jgi:ribonuclease HI
MTRVTIIPFTPTIHLFTDASMKGWGAHVEETLLSGLWSTGEAKLHINLLEMKAVMLAVRQCHQQLTNQNIQLSTDNSLVVAYINKQGGTHSGSLFLLVEELLLYVNNLGSTVRAKHIPGARNVLADQLSRSGQILSTEWTLNQQVANHLFSLWGQPLLDLFATRYTTRLPLFVSPYPDVRAMTTDALAMNWDLLTAYAYPPTILIPQLLRKIASSSARILLIAPAWPDRSWFPALLELLEDVPWELPLWPDLLSQPLLESLNPNIGWLNLHAWPLSGSSSGNQDFQRQLVLKSHVGIDHLPYQYTSPDGPLLSNGVVSGRWTLSKALFPL